MNARPDAVIGQLIDGRYEVTRRIARGGMATVYHAVDKRLDREVAVKVMHPHLAESDDFVARFRREARAAARLSHPNVVAVYDQGLWQDSFYLTMEYVDGEDLRARLRREGTLPLAEALAITEDVLDALAAAHRRGLVHRDIKPENVMINTEAEVLVADFGLARAVSDATAATTGTVLGTVAYLAPELVMRGEASPSSDIYAAGILLYEMLTGTQPFTGDLPINVAMQHVNNDVPAPSKVVRWLPKEIDELVAAMTRRDREDRFQDGASALAQLRSARAGLDDATLSRRATPPKPGTRPTPSGNHTAPLSRKVSTGTVALPVGQIREKDAASSKKRHGPRRALAVLLTLLLAAGAVAGWYFLAGPGAFAPLPDVTGYTSEEATATLEEAGFVPTIVQHNHDDVAENYVISTDPPGDQDARRGSEINVFVSIGVLMLDMPDVVGMARDDALTRLTEEGYPAPTVAEDYSEEVEEGLVMSVTDESGVPVDTTIQYDHRTQLTVTVSLGRKPIEVPGLAGMSQREAEQTLTDLGLTVQYGAEENSTDVDKGDVIRQSPEPGETLYQDGVVTLVLSAGPPLVEVPDLFEMSSAEAKSALEDIGLVPVPDYVWEGVFDTVRFQNPAPGDMVPVGSEVKFTVL